jgi:hypothetical protein
MPVRRQSLAKTNGGSDVLSSSSLLPSPRASPRSRKITYLRPILFVFPPSLYLSSWSCGPFIPPHQQLGKADSVSSPLRDCFLADLQPQPYTVVLSSDVLFDPPVDLGTFARSTPTVLGDTQKKASHACGEMRTSYVHHLRPHTVSNSS